MLIRYESIDGFDLDTVADAVLAALADDTEETIGVDETTEHCTNGGPFTTTTGWTGTNATLSVVSNRLRITNDSNGGAYATFSFATVIGQTYRVSGEWVTDGVTGTLFLNTGTTSTGFQEFYAPVLAPGTTDYIFKATTTTTYLTIQHSSSALSGEYTEWDNISIKKTGNLVANHNFLDSVNGQWTLGDAAATISGGTLSVDGTQATVFYVTQNNILTNLTSYVVTYTISNYVAGWTQAQVSGDGGTSRAANGTYTETLTTSGGINLGFWFDGDFDGDIDNVSVRLAVPDLSLNADGLEVHGQITKTAVATGAGTVWFNNFSTVNRLLQPYNTNLDAGTSGFCGHFWFKSGAVASLQVMVDRAVSGTTAQRFLLYMNTPGTLSFAVDDDTTIRTALTTQEYDDDEPYFCAFDFDGSTLTLAIDGEVVEVATGAALNTLTDADAVLSIGANSSGTQAFGGSIALFQLHIGQNYTAQQMRTIYDNEKVLFQPYEPFAVIGDLVDYEPELGANWTPTPLTKQESTETLDFSRTTVNWGNRLQYDFDVVPFPRTELGKALKFIRSTEGPAFVIDFEGSAASPVHPIDVIKTSNSEPVPNNTSWHSYSCQVRTV